MDSWDTDEAFNILMNDEAMYKALVHTVNDPGDFSAWARELVDDMEDVEVDRVDFQQLWADVRNMD